MPTNLPPEALEAEERYRQAESVDEKITCLEEYISKIPKHKGTDKLRADLRKRLSKLRDSKDKARKGTARYVSVYHIDREGAGQVTLVGPANVGKSALVDALTNAEPEVAVYPFSTWDPTPGMMPIDNIQVQLIDLPPLSREHIEPDMLDLIRRCDLILLVIDLQGFPIEQLHDTVALLEEHHIAPQHRRHHYPGDTHLHFVPLLVVVNKTDDGEADEDFAVLCELLEDSWPMVPVSATAERNFEELKQAIYEQLGIMRIYSKPPGKEPDRSAPFVLPKGSTLEEFAAKVHRDFVDQLKSARLWGTGVFDGQMVGRDHVLHDGDVVELRT